MQDHKRVLSKYWAKNGFTKLKLMLPKFGMTNFSKDQALMFLLVQKHKKTQTPRPKTYNAARKLRVQTANAIDSLTLWHFDAITMLVFDNH